MASMWERGILLNRGSLQDTHPSREQALPVEDTEYAEDVDFARYAAQTAGLSGLAIEVIVRKAAEYSSARRTIEVQGQQRELKIIRRQDLDQALATFKPNCNAAMYNFQTLLALRACNYLDMLPEDDDAFDVRLKAVIQEMYRHKSNVPIVQELARLRGELAAQRML